MGFEIKQFKKFGENEKQIHHSMFGMVTNERVICPVDINENRPILFKLIWLHKPIPKEIPINDIIQANYFVKRNSCLGIILIFIGTPIAITGLGLPIGLLFFFGFLCLTWGMPRARIVTSDDIKVIAVNHFPWKRGVAKDFVSAVNSQLNSKEKNNY